MRFAPAQGMVTPSLPPLVSSVLSATYGTSSTTPVSSGFGLSMTAITDAVRILGQVTITNSVATDATPAYRRRA